MPMVVFDVARAPAAVRGSLARRLLEVRAGLFVGSLSKRVAQQAWEMIIDAKVTSALFAYPSKTETGVSIVTIGNHRYNIIDNYGIGLVRYDRKSGSNGVVG